MTALPIDALREGFRAALARGPVVITSPTGSGKSTQVPRWFDGRVLVIEPRRLACRALAARVAELEGTPLGGAVGYNVRDEHRVSDATRVLFVTPGVALRMADAWGRYGAVVIDEFHERGIDTDLLLALLQKQRSPRLVVMSATLDGDRVAAHLGGRHLRVDVRTFPVTTHHLQDNPAQLPTRDHLETRVRRAGGCDATALIRAVRLGDPVSDGLSRMALDDARRTRARLRRAHDLPNDLGSAAATPQRLLV